MNDDIAWQIRHYAREHCSNNFPPDRHRQTQIVRLAGYSRLRVGVGRAVSSQAWQQCSSPLSSCKDERIRAVAHQQYDLAQEMFDEMTDWVEPEKPVKTYQSDPCGCIGYQ